MTATFPLPCRSASTAQCSASVLLPAPPLRANTPMVFVYGSGELVPGPGREPNFRDAGLNAWNNFLQGLVILFIIVVTLLPWVLVGSLVWWLVRLARRAGPFFRSPGVSFPYLVGFFRRNGVIDDSTRVVVQHDRIEGATPFQQVLRDKVDLARGDRDVLFLTAYTNSVREAYRRAREARAARPAVRIVPAVSTARGSPRPSARWPYATRRPSSARSCPTRTAPAATTASSARSPTPAATPTPGPPTSTPAPAPAARPSASDVSHPDTASHPVT